MSLAQIRYFSLLCFHEAKLKFPLECLEMLSDAKINARKLYGDCYGREGKEFSFFFVVTRQDNDQITREIFCTPSKFFVYFPSFRFSCLEQ